MRTGPRHWRARGHREITWSFTKVFFKFPKCFVSRLFQFFFLVLWISNGYLWRYLWVDSASCMIKRFVVVFIVTAIMCHHLPVQTDKWGNGTECGSANKRFWGSLRRGCKWILANSCIKVIQEIWNRPVRSNSHNDATVVHWIYRSSWYWGNFSELTHPPGQRRERCLADRCQRSYTENNGKVCYAREKVQCHWCKWFPSSLCRAQKPKWSCNSHNA